jgi:hypothetical protein
MAVRPVSLKRLPPFIPLGRLLVLISLRGCINPRATVQQEGLDLSKKYNDMGIEPTTFRLVT